MYSNAYTTLDSVTDYRSYVDRCVECGMSAIAFTEHGNVLSWLKKKEYVEAKGLKYIHGIEAYVTETLDEKTRDNYHVVLLARNYEGVLEINRLSSQSFNRKDNHFYYAPRITFDDLLSTSENVLVLTACLGGILHNGSPSLKHRFMNFILAHKDRCFLEVQPHLDVEQLSYNQELEKLHAQYGLRLVATSDVHALDERHLRGRSIMQRAKGIHFENEEAWDLRFKDESEMTSAFLSQGALRRESIVEAMETTRFIADLARPFEVDRSIKYPNLFENPDEELRRRVYEAIPTHPYALKHHTLEEIKDRVDMELDAYSATGASPYMLLKDHQHRWEVSAGIHTGPGRGSVSGSMVAYLLGITQMDSMRFNLNFSRFINKDRISLADIDVDYSEEDRAKTREYMLRDHMFVEGLHTAEIITFNTIAMKGAVRDVARALEIDDQTLDEILGGITDDPATGQSVSDNIRLKYKEVFDYVDIVIGCIVSIGSHPCGILVCDRDVEAIIGLCSTSGSDYPVTQLNMKELDSLNVVKLDILGLDNVDVINRTCRMVGIDIVTPDNIDLEDETVWKEIREDTTCIFQWESNSAQSYLRRFMSESTLGVARGRVPNFSLLKWFSFGNGLLRPSCASYRDEVADGKFYDNGLRELNDFLAQEAGHLCMQETIMGFLVAFCGYTQSESDSVRRKISKKGGTEDIIPEIERRFVEYTPSKYGVTPEKAKEIIVPFTQVILDASRYSFSQNHADAYSFIGYAMGYLRHYYPLEFISAALNVFSNNDEKTADIIRYASLHRIQIYPPRFGHSRSTYSVDREHNAIYKGMQSIKHISAAAADELFEISKHLTSRDSLMEALQLIQNSSVDKGKLDVLIALDFFAEYGNIPTVGHIVSLFRYFKSGQAKVIFKDRAPDGELLEILRRHATDQNKKGETLKSYQITDMAGLLAECESFARSCNHPDVDMRVRLQSQIDYLGYVDCTTGRMEDRQKLIVLGIRPLKSKKTKNIWAYEFTTKSIGSGVQARLTVYSYVFSKNPVDPLDIIHVKPEWLFKNKKGYWNLLKYEPVFE